MQERAYKPMTVPSGDVELVADLFYRQYDILFRLTTQMLATRDVEDRLSLVLDAVTFELGYEHAAIAFADNDTASLQIRMALGFSNNNALAGLHVPTHLGISFGGTQMEWRPIWIMRSN